MGISNGDFPPAMVSCERELAKTQRLLKELITKWRQRAMFEDIEISANKLLHDCVDELEKLNKGRRT